MIADIAHLNLKLCIISIGLKKAQSDAQIMSNHKNENYLFNVK